MEISHKFLSLLVICMIFIQVQGKANVHRGLLQTDETTIDCPAKCDARCALASRADRCIQYCLICCDRCHCVPSGTSGNRDECKCYAEMKNSKGGNKCP